MMDMMRRIKMQTSKCTNLILKVAILILSAGIAATPAQDMKDIEIPFVDRDGDGINDLLQNGWGLRFMNRYKKRQQVWEQLNVEVVRGDQGMMVDTDGDGVGDVSMRDYMKSIMGKLIDTDGDGIPDTPLKNYLGRRFKAFDKDGDGLPDEISREEMRAQMQQMQQWRETIRERIRRGLPAFTDDDGDGVPDNLPSGFGWRGGDGRGKGRR
jgi:hypothetical protein